jgi:hypothetical protein
MPRAAVSLESGETVPVCIMAFDLPENDPHLGLELLNAEGGQTESGSLLLASVPERTDEGLYRVMASLETTGLPAGEYQIRVVYRGADGGSDAMATRDFEVHQPER